MTAQPREQLPTADITVKYVNPAKEGKKFASIKDEQGQYYGVWPNMLEQFSPGMKCRVEYEAKPKDGGGEWRTIKKIINGNVIPMVPPVNARQRTHPTDAAQIGGMVVFKELMAKLDGMPTLRQTADILNMAFEAYSMSKFAGVQAQRADDLNDEIPF